MEATALKDFVQTVHDLGPLLSRQIDQEESDRRLSPVVIGAMREAGLYKMLLPKSLGGYQLDPVSTARVVEQVAGYNTAAAWSLMVANTSAWWGRNMSEKGVEEIFQTGSDTFLAGAIHPPMQAIATDGGYRITGRSPLCSNVHQAAYLICTALVFENGKPKISNGIPQAMGICLKRSDCQVIDTWFTIGMKATDSNDIAADNVFVPHHLCFPLMPGREPNKYYDAPPYRFATIGISVPAMIAPVALGLGANAINELKAMAIKKTPLGSMVSIREKGVVQRKLGIAEGLVQSSRAYLYQTLSQAWQKTVSGETLSNDEKAGLLLAGVHTTQSCLQAIDMVYAAAGSSAIYLKNKLAHYFIDAQVIRQYGFVNESRYETAAQIFFGLPPDLAVVVF